MGMSLIVLVGALVFLGIVVAGVVMLVVGRKGSRSAPRPLSAPTTNTAAPTTPGPSKPSTAPSPLAPPRRADDDHTPHTGLPLRDPGP